LFTNALEMIFILGVAFSPVGTSVLLLDRTNPLVFLVHDGIRDAKDSPRLLATAPAWNVVYVDAYAAF
jgi:hypothetical protein